MYPMNKAATRTAVLFLLRCLGVKHLCWRLQVCLRVGGLGERLGEFFAAKWGKWCNGEEKAA